MTYRDYVTYRDGLRRSFSLAVFITTLTAFGIGYALPSQASITQAWSSIGPFSASGQLNILATVQNGSDLYVAGDFTNAGGITGADYLAKWNGTNWSAVGQDPGGGVPRLNHPVHTMVIINDVLYLGGEFTGAGGISGADYIAGVNLTTGGWSKLGAGSGPYGLSSSGYVFAMYVDASTTPTSLVFGGKFTDAGAQSNTRYAARYTPGVDTYTSIGGTTSYMGSAAQITAISHIGTTYYFGFSNVGTGNSYGLLKKYSTVSSSWSDVSWGASWSSAKDYVGGTYAGVFALLAVGTDLYVGGNFFSAGGSHSYMARLETSTAPETWHGIGADDGCPASFPSRCIRNIFILDNSVYFAGDVGIYRVSGLTGRQYPLKLGGAPPAVFTATTSAHAFTAGGTFNNAGGISAADYLARFSSSTASTLDTLSLSTGPLNTSFASGTTSYSVTASSATTTVSATSSNDGAAIDFRINGGAWSTLADSGISAELPLNIGGNTIDLRVDPSDSSGSLMTYTLTVTRPSNNADLAGLVLSAGSLSPVFASGTTSYIASVDSDVSSITVTPTKANSEATITVNGTAVASGSQSGALPLNEGANTLTTEVTAGDLTTRTYVVTVTRSAAPASPQSPTPSADPPASTVTVPSTVPATDSTTPSTLPTKSAQTAPSTPAKLKVRKSAKIAATTPQGVPVKVTATGACKAKSGSSGTTITAGKKAGKCTVTFSAAETASYAAFSASATIKVVK